MKPRQDNILPTSPPALSDQVTLRDDHLPAIANIIGVFSRGIENMPVVLCQNGEVVQYAGRADDSLAHEVAQLTDHGWREGATRVSREYIRFEEEVFLYDDVRLNLLLYSMHIKAALVLTVGWQFSVSLTQLRAEMADARLEILDIINAR